MFSGDCDITVIRKTLPQTVRATLVAVNWDADAVRGVIQVLRESPQFQGYRMRVVRNLRAQWRAIWDGCQWGKLWQFVQTSTSVLRAVAAMAFWAFTVSVRARHAERVLNYLTNGR